MTTSPPCLHETAWWPSGSKAMTGQKGQEDLAVEFMPSHHFTAVWNSEESIIFRFLWSGVFGESQLLNITISLLGHKEGIGACISPPAVANGWGVLPSPICQE